MMRAILHDELFPHQTGGLRSKGVYLAYLARKLMYFHLGLAKETDRDSLVNKKILSTGDLLFLLVKEWINNVKKDLKTQYKKLLDKNTGENVNILDYVSQIFNNNELFRKAMNTGDWGKNSYYKGVCSALKSLSHLDTFSHIRSVKAPTTGDNSANKSGASRRSIHPTQYGYMSGPDTPEGAKIGLSQALCVSAQRTEKIPFQASLIKTLMTNVNSYVAGKSTKVQFGKKSVILGYDADFLEEYLKPKADSLTRKGNVLTIKGSNYVYNEILIMSAENLCSIVPIERMPYEDLDKTKVLLNNELIGVTEHVGEWRRYLKHLIWEGVLHCHVSVSYNVLTNCLVIQTSSGRLVRPLWRVENSTVLADITAIHKERMSGKTLDEVMKKYPGVIEYLDPTEIGQSLIARNFKDIQKSLTIKNGNGDGMWSDYTHMEVHPSFVFGYLSNLVPYVSCNHGPRVTYATIHLKQAICRRPNDLLKEYRSEIITLASDEQPYIRTSMYDILKLPSNGANVNVAFMCYGDNQEDSVVLSRKFVESGRLDVCIFRVVAEEVVGEEQFMLPERETVDRIRPVHRYRHLNSDGFPKIGDVIEVGDAIIGKVVKSSSSIGKLYKDISRYAKKRGVVFSISRTPTHNGINRCRVKIAEYRPVRIGDKLSNRYGQKATVSNIIDYPPFTENGDSIDMIMNPHSIPSRMTIGQILEMVNGKLVQAEMKKSGSSTPKPIYANPFEPHNTNETMKSLEKHGLDPMCEETVYSGKTGIKLKNKIFIGPVYYFRLKHMVIDKVYTRTTGPSTTLTRQPVDGRAKGGGQRLGEMERDNLLSHGLAFFLNERMMKCSDGYTAHVCNRCGEFAAKGIVSGIYECKNRGCDSTFNDISMVEIPYAFKYLKQQLKSLDIKCSIHTD